MKAKIGLEIHGYLLTEQKLFCECATNYQSAKPNTNICPICTAQPGSKPMLPNEEAVKKAIAIAAMLGCKIATAPLVWQRKHYDWPDLPKGYQDTISGAYAAAVGEKGKFHNIRIRSAHLEEDPARWDPSTGRIDYNRCGMPLIEIVTEPDFSSAKDVREWLNQLVLSLSYIKALDKEAGIKADINVSVKINSKEGERVEIKNIHSIYFIEKAIDYEILRQSGLLRSGQKVQRETRAFNEATRTTVAMRAKELVADYRFIPDPDLPALLISKEEAKAIQAALPEAPYLKIKRFRKQYKITEKQAAVLANDPELADFFEQITKKVPPKLAANWVTVELLRVLNWNKKRLHEVDIKPQHFIELLKLVNEKRITELAAKRILNRFVPSSFSPAKEKGRISDKVEIEKICKEIIEKNKKAAEDFKRGIEKALFFLIGRVMEATHRRADNKIVREVMLKLLKA